MQNFKWARFMAAAIVSLVLTACGGISDPAPTAAPVPDMPTGLAASTVPDGFGLTWAAVTATAGGGAVTYRVLVDQDGDGPLAPVARDIVLTSASYTVTGTFELSAADARYSVQACNASGCGTPSASVAIGVSLPSFLLAAPARADSNPSVVVLSADGSTMAVGVANDSSAATGINGNQADTSAPYSGAIFVYTRSGGAWVQQAYLKMDTGQILSNFGAVIALSRDGSTLAAGASDFIGGGRAFIFSRSGGTWSQQARLVNTGPEADPNDRLGGSIALSADGNTVAVGDPVEDLYNGSVYVYTRAGTAWSQQARVKTGTPGDHNLGTSVALSADGNTMAVGAPIDASNALGVGGDELDTSAAYSGAAYVFTRTGSTWTKQAFLKASLLSENFGWSVAISADGNTVAVGAIQESNGVDAVGATYVFARASGAWIAQARQQSATSGANNEFGRVVALSLDGTLLAVSAKGSSYLYARSAGAWSARASF